MSNKKESDVWTRVCELNDIPVSMGVAAVVGKEQVALFRFYKDEVYAINNFDPFSLSNVISRGILGSHKMEPMVTSPIYKQQFSLRTGECLQDRTIKLSTFMVKKEEQSIFIKHTNLKFDRAKMKC